MMILMFNEQTIIFVGLEKIESEESRSTNGLTAAVSCAAVAFLMISLLTFIAGCVCGHYFGRKSKQPSRGTPDHPLANQPVPLYEDVNVLPSAMEHQEQGLELRENVAYGPSKSMNISIQQ